MTATKSTKVLEREHQAIQKVVATMSVVADRLDTVHNVEAAIVRNISTLGHDFSEECHHAKEERFLLPWFEARGVPASGCPIAVLHRDYEKCHASLAQPDDATPAFLLTAAGRDRHMVDSRNSILVPISRSVCRPIGRGARLRNDLDQNQEVYGKRLSNRGIVRDREAQHPAAAAGFLLMLKKYSPRQLAS